MATSFTVRLNELFTMLQTAPDAEGNRRPFTVSEIHTEIIVLTGGAEKMSERRIRQLKDLHSDDGNPTVKMVQLLARAFESLSRKANPDGPHPSFDELNHFLTTPANAVGENDVMAEVPTAPSRDIVSVMGRYWDFDDETRARVVEFMQNEEARLKGRGGLLRRRRGRRSADESGDTGSPPGR